MDRGMMSQSTVFTSWLVSCARGALGDRRIWRRYDDTLRPGVRRHLRRCDGGLAWRGGGTGVEREGSGGGVSIARSDTGVGQNRG